ncbi:class I SAM-dependent methyltransferase [Pararhodonellum marinum]|uniref:class I SAM-dependent methyltransferase n=1 Tax=Pararhodonellum marinum TaxID=2755358 RepID=UPI00188FD11F|nr:class I SAM-dependent methyltransferase [Pararhodonellum marinum]
MNKNLSVRLSAFVNALPLYDGIRVLEIGCGSGAAARAILNRISDGHVLGIDRSEKAILMAISKSQNEINSGLLTFRKASVEAFDLRVEEDLFDLAFAVRVGALDGRHPEIENQALTKIAKALTKNGKLFIDGGNPLKEIPLDGYR